MQDLMSAEINRIRKQIGELVDEVSGLIDRERELTDTRSVSSLRKSCGDLMHTQILRIRKQIEKLMDEVFQLIERERELTDEHTRFVGRLMKSYGSP